MIVTGVYKFLCLSQFSEKRLINFLFLTRQGGLQGFEASCDSSQIKKLGVALLFADWPNRLEAIHDTFGFLRGRHIIIQFEYLYNAPSIESQHFFVSCNSEARCCVSTLDDLAEGSPMIAR